MKKKYKYLALALLFLGLVLVPILFLLQNNIAVLNPEGIIASKQRNLLIATVLLSLLIVLPVFALTFGIAWRYRAGNTKAKYTPDWDHNTKLEALWWGIPCVIILVLAVVTWRSSHDLDPYKPLVTQAKPITIQVIALEWKWLFIYPEQNIATVNVVRFPEKTPVNFEITADAPMNSFWIPQLGGQVYAMAGMNTKLHLMADRPGTYYGSSANLSGEGFAGMKFTAHSSTKAAFDNWVQTVRRSPELNPHTYNTLAQPSKNIQQAYYASTNDALYDTVVMKYMMPSPHNGMKDMNMRGTEHDSAHHH